MDSKLHYFTQNAMRKHGEKEHMTIYEKAACGGFHQSQLSTVDHDAISKFTDSTIESKQKEVDDLRKRGLESFTNDMRMEIPIMWTWELLFRVNVYKFVNGAIQFK
jgi:hypothetical protein